MPSSEYEPLVAAKQPPPLNIPSGSTVSVKIIDTTTDITLPLVNLMSPKIPGHDNLHCPAYSFLIEHSSGRKVLFDLGTRKDVKNFSPAIVQLISCPGWEFNAEKDVAEVLEENGVATKSIEAAVWSHWHFDHVGNMKTFPDSVKVIVGPGFKNNLMPGYPINKDSHLLESDWEGREVVEVKFDTGLKLGRYKAFDYFEDGSFYILDAPGHAIGHICGLARVTEDSFVLMGGDTCHHAGLWRPNQYLPLPKEVSLSKPIRGMSVCPGSMFQSVHRDDSASTEFYKIAANNPQNFDEAVDSMHNMQEFDAAENVLVIIAHDRAPLDPKNGFKFFPNGTLNDWKKERLNEKMRWSFLQDFASAVENGAKQEAKADPGLTFRVQEPVSE